MLTFGPSFGGRLLRPSFTFGLRGNARRAINSYHVHAGRGSGMMDNHDEERAAGEKESTTVTEKNGDLKPAGDVAEDAPADHEETVAGSTSTSSNTAASSGSPGDSSRHKKNSSSPADRGGNGDLKPTAGDAAKDAPADRGAVVAGPTSTSSNAAASSGSHGDSSRHKKNSSSPADRGGNGDLKPTAGDAAKDAPADHGAVVAGPTSTSSNTAASSGSHGDSSHHKKNSSSSTARSGPPSKITKFFSMDYWWSRSAAETLDYGSMSLEEKRSHYKCGRDYLTLHGIPTWSNSHKTIPYPELEGMNASQYSVDPDLNKKVSLWQGDITRLEIDAIVNAANSSLLGGGGVDGAIHRAASNALRMECEDLGGCHTGDAKISGGHRLPAKYVIHTVGPINSRREKLQSCYHRCLELVLERDIKSVAFSCIATGVYGYPHDAAAKVALETTREWLEEHHNKVDRIIFCVFQKVDCNWYSKLLHYYYPVPVKERTVELPETRVKRGAKKPKKGPGVVPPSLSGGGGGDSVGTSTSAGTPEPGRMETDPEIETGDSVSKTPAAKTKVSPSSVLAAVPEAVGEKARDDDGVDGGDGGDGMDEGVTGVTDREGETRGDDGKMETVDSFNTTEGEKESR